jgi:F-type H+-transporting ATPase subunit b
MRRILAAIVMLALPSVADAAEKGMPQLNFANPLTLAQVVWLAIIFFALYLLLDRWALPKVSDVLEMRASKIAADLDAAKEAKTHADAAVAELVAATKKAQAEAQASVSSAVDAAKAAAAAEAAIANTKLEAQLADAEARINAARAASVGALHDVALTTTAELVGRLCGFAPEPATVEHAVGRALTARAA